MADRTRELATHDTPLGPLAGWSDTLVWSLNMMLESRFPTSVFWGPEMLHFYNDAYIPFSAEKHPKLLACPAAVAWAEAWHIIGPQFESVFQDGKTVYQENVLVPVIRAGELRDVYWTYSYSPIRTSQGEICAILIVCHDVTAELNATRERDAYQANLQRSEKQYRTLFSSMDEGYCVIEMIFDMEGKPVDWTFLEVNPAFEKHNGLSNAANKRMLELVPEIEPEWFELYGRVARTGEALRLQRESPALQRWFDLYAFRIGESGSNQVAILFTEISARKKTEAALIRSEKLAAVGRMASTISHEINNPLAAVTNLLYLIRSAKDAEQMRALARTAETELARVSHIATHTLRFHRQSHAATIERLSSLLDSSLVIFESRMRQQNIKLVRDYVEQDSACCFASEVRQVTANLIGNAIDATKAGGFIYVRTRARRNVHGGELGVRLTIADSGEGMSKETLLRIFEPFFSTKGLNGSGLGLWISHEILARHYATIRVRSRRRTGRSGTVFSIWFPADRVPQVGFATKLA